jgi:hypothetical protein
MRREDYFKAGELYVGGLHRTGDDKSLNDFFVPVILVDRVIHGWIAFTKVGLHPKYEGKSGTERSNTFNDTDGNRQFYRRLNDPYVINKGREVIVAVLDRRKMV